MTDILSKVCSIPRDFKTLRNKSVAQLLKESCYLENPMVLNQETLIEFLERNPKFIEDWAAYSIDKRTRGGWYFITNDNQSVVGCLINGKNKNEQVFASPTEACASFIINEVHSIASNVS